ncbi:hypothetical protein F3Y22_tig00111057pilonHSYRG00020 [Hibiscus syriacus]|uniref:Thioredoxin domain-containing protein n=1 Tax=Hibiscus syriacus TaxID=106335 RepID=A0A6A2Z3L7_HIBSY|nr:hypothetical protein F3Y22_tig00111057pilonHSYRG00020 [Hibiscus syriacus]
MPWIEIFFFDSEACKRLDGSFKVPVSEFERKTVGLCFWIFSFKPCADFTPKLAEVYKKLKEKGENFEARRKTLHPNAADAVEEHGIEAYPFTPEKFAELEEIEKQKRQYKLSNRLWVRGIWIMSLGRMGIRYDCLVSLDALEIVRSCQGDRLGGKTILLYFSAHWCPPCHAFTPNLVQAYYSAIPWLAFPFDDARKSSLSRRFKLQSIPMLVAIGPTRKTITKETRGLVMAHGADAFPFTEEWLKEIEVQYEEMAKGWPLKLKHKLHEEHDMVCNIFNTGLVTKL